MSHRGALCLAAWLWAGAAEAAPDLERCRQLESEFDYRAMITDCSVAAANPANTREASIELYRLLGFAHVALGDEAAAEMWFLRVLLLDPGHTLAPEVSPKFRESFAKAVQSFQRDGKVVVSHTAPAVPERVDLQTPLLPLAFDVQDRLGRVATARVRVRAILGDEAGRPVSAGLRRVIGDGPGAYRFEGVLPDPARVGGAVPQAYQLEYQLELQNSAGDLVTPEPGVKPVTLSFVGEAAPVGDVDALWAAATAGAVGGLLLAGAAVGVGLYCAAGYCATQPITRPVGWVSVSVAGSAP